VKRTVKCCSYMQGWQNPRFLKIANWVFWVFAGFFGVFGGFLRVFDGFLVV